MVVDDQMMSIKKRNCQKYAKIANMVVFHMSLPNFPPKGDDMINKLTNKRIGLLCVL